MRFTFGADPEIFVFSKDKGEPISAHGMIPGSKSDPFHVPNGAVQVDGMALEFNINPASSKKQFTGNVFSVLKHMQSMLPEGVETRVLPSVFFDKSYIREQPLEARILGCDPDLNAYTQRFNPTPDANQNMRTAAGHIHIGWGSGGFDIKSKEHLDSCYRLTKTIDLLVGVWSLYRDRDTQRRRLYGQAGSFRPKPYGMEYRTLSNFWLRDPRLTAEVFDRTKDACNKLVKDPRHLDNVNGSQVQYAINHSDIYEADDLVRQHGILL